MLPNLSVFQNAQTNQPFAQTATEDVIVSRVRSGKYQPQTEALRSLTDEASRSACKRADFIGVTWSGTFAPIRKAEQLQQHSGLICLDIDKLPPDRLPALRTQLQADDYTRVLFVSPSGNGLKVVVQIECDNAATHALFFQQLSDYYRDCYGVEIDKSGKDVSRLCFLPHDAEAYYNPHSATMPLAEEYRTPPERKAPPTSSPSAAPRQQSPTDDTEARVVACIEQLVAQRIDITAGYDNWLTIGFALASLGEAGRTYFHQVSQLNEGYSQPACEAKFSELLRTGNGAVGIGTFFQKCHEAGVTATASTGRIATSRPLALSSEAWPEPLPLQVSLLPVEPLIADMLPEALRAWVFDIAHRMNCPLDFVGASAVVMLSSLIGSRLIIRPKHNDNWPVTPNLWGGVVAGPSMKKTPSMSAVLKPLHRLEGKANQAHKQAMNAYEAGKITYEAQKKAYQSQEGKRAKGEAITQEVAFPKELPKPAARRYLTNDSTIEKMTLLLDENPAGLLMFRDEITGLLAGWEKQGREEDRAFYLEAWNGNGSRTVDRISRESVFVRPVCVSLLGGIQPPKLLTYLQAQANYENDGLTQRLQVLVYPDTPTPRYVDEAEDQTARDRAYSLVEQMAEADFMSIGYAATEYDPAYTRFTDEAQEVFKAWVTKWESEVVPNEMGLLQEHFAKYPSLMPSLALVFHVVNVIEQPAPTDPQQKQLVSLEAARMAVRWCNYLASHARRIYGLLDTMNTEAAQSLLKHLKAHDLLATFKAREVQKKGWSGLTNMDDIEAALSVLVAHHWLRMEEGATDTGGRPQAATYFVHPKISQNT
jgi:hypothetical protein